MFKNSKICARMCRTKLLKVMSTSHHRPVFILITTLWGQFQQSQAIHQWGHWRTLFWGSTSAQCETLGLITMPPGSAWGGALILRGREGATYYFAKMSNNPRECFFCPSIQYHMYPAVWHDSKLSHLILLCSTFWHWICSQGLGKYSLPVVSDCWLGSNFVEKFEMSEIRSYCQVS